MTHSFQQLAAKLVRLTDFQQAHNRQQEERNTMPPKKDASIHAEAITAAARAMVDASQPSKRNALRPHLATIIDATQKLHALADPKKKPDTDKEQEK